MELAIGLHKQVCDKQINDTIGRPQTFDADSTPELLRGKWFPKSKFLKTKEDLIKHVIQFKIKEILQKNKNDKIRFFNTFSWNNPN